MRAGEWVITVERPNGGAAIGTCTLRWALVDRATGEPQPLPESLSDKLQGWVAAAD